VTLRERIKSWWFGLLGKDPQAVVVVYLTGDPALAYRMVQEVRQLIPDRPHFVVALESYPHVPGLSITRLEPGTAFELWQQLRTLFRRYRVGMAPVLFSGEPEGSELRLAAFLNSPLRILAYNNRLERHHLQLSSPISSTLFLKGVALDRIHLRPRWLVPWKRDRSVYPTAREVYEGRPLGARKRVAVITPFLPYPLSHGGAVRLYNLLREIARDFDVFLFAFRETGKDDAAHDVRPLLEFCSYAALVAKPRYREPGWSSLRPPEVCEYDSPAMHSLLQEMRRKFAIELMQLEYTALAGYGSDILVEHDITYDLFAQVHRRKRSLGTWWDWWRWRRYERRAVARYRRVVAMSTKDAAMLGGSHVRVIPNGCDLERFQPSPEPSGQRLLFIGSFRHFPNVVAYRFFTEQVWPRLREQYPQMTVTVVAGPDYASYWQMVVDSAAPPEDPRIRLLGFVEDVRPLYREANLVLVPTVVSAGTNLKVLEAMAMRRAVVSTTSGSAGLGLLHRDSIWIGDSPDDFTAGITTLIDDPKLRARLARAAFDIVSEKYSWSTLGESQRNLMHELLNDRITVRKGTASDVIEVTRIQSGALPGSAWDPIQYTHYPFLVAEMDGKIAGFLVSRQTGPDEQEILNLAVDTKFRRQGVGEQLLRRELEMHPGYVFLEVRESNTAARKLYEKLGFREVGKRPNYYENPPETAIVMRLQSC
jgi:polysaccharide biosynthesis protein PslH